MAKLQYNLPDGTIVNSDQELSNEQLLQVTRKQGLVNGPISREMSLSLPGAIAHIAPDEDGVMTNWFSVGEQGKSKRARVRASTVANGPGTQFLFGIDNDQGVDTGIFQRESVTMGFTTEQKDQIKAEYLSKFLGALRKEPTKARRFVQNFKAGVGELTTGAWLKGETFASDIEATRFQGDLAGRAVELRNRDTAIRTEITELEGQPQGEERDARMKKLIDEGLQVTKDLRTTNFMSDQDINLVTATIDKIDQLSKGLIKQSDLSIEEKFQALMLVAGRLGEFDALPAWGEDVGPVESFLEGAAALFGQFTPQAGDPVNWIPIFGAAGKVSKGVFPLLKRAGKEGAEAFVGSVATEPFVQQAKLRTLEQAESSISQGLEGGALSFGFGFGTSLAGRALGKFFRDVGDRVRAKEIDGKSLPEILDIFEKATGRKRESYERELIKAVNEGRTDKIETFEEAHAIMREEIRTTAQKELFERTTEQLAEASLAREGVVRDPEAKATPVKPESGKTLDDIEVTQTPTGESGSIRFETLEEAEAFLKENGLVADDQKITITKQFKGRGDNRVLKAVFININPSVGKRLSAATGEGAVGVNEFLAGQAKSAPTVKTKPISVDFDDELVKRKKQIQDDLNQIDKPETRARIRQVTDEFATEILKEKGLDPNGPEFGKAVTQVSEGLRDSLERGADPDKITLRDIERVRQGEVRGEDFSTLKEDEVRQAVLDSPDLDVDTKANILEVLDEVDGGLTVRPNGRLMVMDSLKIGRDADGRIVATSDVRSAGITKRIEDTKILAERTRRRQDAEAALGGRAVEEQARAKKQAELEEVFGPTKVDKVIEETPEAFKARRQSELEEAFPQAERTDIEARVDAELDIARKREARAAGIEEAFATPEATRVQEAVGVKEGRVAATQKLDTEIDATARPQGQAGPASITPRAITRQVDQALGQPGTPLDQIPDEILTRIGQNYKQKTLRDAAGAVDAPVRNKTKTQMVRDIVEGTRELEAKESQLQARGEELVGEARAEVEAGRPAEQVAQPLESPVAKERETRQAKRREQRQGEISKLRQAREQFGKEAQAASIRTLERLSLAFNPGDAKFGELFSAKGLKDLSVIGADLLIQMAERTGKLISEITPHDWGKEMFRNFGSAVQGVIGSLYDLAVRIAAGVQQGLGAPKKFLMNWSPTDGISWSKLPIFKTFDEITSFTDARIRRLLPKVWQKIRKEELLGNQLAAKWVKQADSFFKSMKKAQNIARVTFNAKGFTPERQVRMQTAMFNSDRVTVEAVIRESFTDAADAATAIKALDDVYKTFEDVRKELLGTGIEIGEIKDFWPRIVRDHKGLLKYLSGQLDRSEVNARIKQEGRVNGLSDIEKAELLNRMLLEKRGQSQTDPTKSRQIDVLSEGATQYYARYDDAAATYFGRIGQLISEEKLLGKRKLASAKTMTGARLVTEQVGFEGAADTRMVVDRGDILTDPYLKKQTDAERVKDILATEFFEDFDKLGDADKDVIVALLQSRLVNRKASPNRVIAGLRNLTYVATVAKYVVALTNLYDTGVIAFVTGPVNTILGIKGVLTKTNRVSVQTLGFGLDAELLDARNMGATAGFLDFSMTAVGFKKLDIFMKNVFLEASYQRMRRAKSGEVEKIINQWADTLGRKDTAKGIDDIKNGRISAEADLLLWNEIGEVQPISKGDMPQWAMDNPNTRIFMMLKSFILKRLEFVRKNIAEITADGANDILKGNRAQGLAKLRKAAENTVGIGLLVFGTAAIGDSFKDWARNKALFYEDIWNNTFTNNFIDEMYSLVGMNRYIVQKLGTVQETPDLIVTLLGALTPVFNVAGDVAIDGVAIATGRESPRDVRSMRYLPMAGDLLYGRWGRGRDIDRKETAEWAESRLGDFGLNAQREASGESRKESQAARDEAQEILSIRSREDARAALLELAQSDPALFERTVRTLKSYTRDQGLTLEERKIKHKVSSPVARAKVFWEKVRLEKLDRRATAEVLRRWDELGFLTPRVIEEIGANRPQ